MEMSVEQMVERAVRRQLGVQAATAKGLPEIPFRDIWAQHDREVLHPESGESRRKDAVNFRAHRALILELRFSYDGEDVCLGDMLVSRFCPEVGETWLQKLLAAPKTRVKSGESTLYSGSTVNRIVASLQSVLSWKFGRHGNPFKRMPRQKTEGRHSWFEGGEPQLEDFLTHCRPDLADMMRLICNAGGLRKSEVRLLQIAEIDWDAQKIVIPGKKTETRTGTKNGKDRIVPLAPREFAMLSARRARAKALGTVYLFPSPSDPDSGPINDRTLSGWMKQAGDSWGKLLNGKRPIIHMGRHTWATWAAVKGVPFIAIKRQGGWENSGTVERYIQDAAEIHAQTLQLLGVTLAEAQEAAAQRAGFTLRKGPKRHPAQPIEQGDDEEEAA